MEVSKDNFFLALKQAGLLNPVPTEAIKTAVINILDKDGGGFLSLKEISSALQKLCPTEKKKKPKKAKELSADQVDAAENALRALQAAIAKEGVASRFKDKFMDMDDDGSGALSKKEVLQVLKA